MREGIAYQLNASKVEINRVENYLLGEGHSENFPLDDKKEGPNHNGWQHDAIILTVDGIEAGFIRVRYIPKSYWDNVYENNLVSFLRMMENEYSIDESLCERDAIIGHFLKNARYGKNEDDALTSIYRSKLITYNFIRNRFVNKPVVDYINLTQGFDDGVMGKINHGISFRSLGLSKILYEEMALWMAQKGLKLYASSSQTPLAKKAWDRLGILHGEAISSEPFEYQISFPQYKNGEIRSYEVEDFFHEPRRYLNGNLIERTNHPDIAEIWYRDSTHHRDKPASFNQGLQERQTQAHPSTQIDFTL